ncbi:MAG: SDR family oxidoreductase [Acidobacteria bacterium]|nr:SDR family oxidoreductase [Acidobacteriota bacterium]
MKILVTGATGYIGGRLIPKLLDRGLEVRAFAREPNLLRGRKWADRVEIFKGDLNDRSSIEQAAKGCDAAYFLVHAMYSGENFAEKEKLYAENFAEAAKDLPNVIYLGGLLPEEKATSEHLESRANVGEILRQRGNCTEFRAGPIIGSGSASFEMVRYLTERIPIMTVPKWVKNPVQPIAVRDVIDYLAASLDKEPLGVVDIGANILSFGGMMEVFAEIRGLKRIIIPVPVLTPLLSGLWVGLVTPIPNSLALPLVKGIITPVLANLTKAEKHFPGIKPMGYREAVRLALTNIEKKAVETRWRVSAKDDESYDLTDKEGLIREVRMVLTDAPPDTVFRSFTSIGGENGWLAWRWAWEIRGLLDSLIGGPGLSRGRRHPTELFVGEELDFWRVEDIQENKLLLLRAEMKVPGKAWLQFEAAPIDGKTQLIQTALFAPKGLLGFLYWYSFYPAHYFIFEKMAQQIVKNAELEAESPSSN